MSHIPSSPTVRPQEDHEGLQVVPDDGLQTPDPQESPVTKDLKFQPYSAGSAYGGPLNVREPASEVPPGPESPPPAFHLINEYKTGRNNTLPVEDTPPPQSIKEKRLCGLKKRTFWLLILLLLIAIIGLAVGLGVGLSGSKSSTPSSSSTAGSTTGTPTSSGMPSSSSPIGQTCVNGTGPGNYLGLCSFSCNYGYCPPPCSCLQFSATAVPPPPISNTPGFPLPGENADYTGLCSFTCNHGYCPEGACTTDSSVAGNSSSSASVSTPSSVSSQLPSSSLAPLTLTAPTSTVVVTLQGSQTSTVVVVPTSA
ncbi:hypothetical protein MFRU_055g00060 [Monilinia fructicola]|uniref:Uncharacterized protein n=1 Tax=Monilinia fructicola TaxID=38448 RepID=A0A5M9JP39_MONFR|nr:hypothetical protein EYC84_000592 [Monilinia fructicola]KAG4025533.1 hypothetical protein MFRU_055g00060 [Monilinia fructicola]